jgi:hypothetical protein
MFRCQTEKGPLHRLVRHSLGEVGSRGEGGPVRHSRGEGGRRSTVGRQRRALPYNQHGARCVLQDLFGIASEQ